MSISSIICLNCVDLNKTIPQGARCIRGVECPNGTFLDAKTKRCDSLCSEKQIKDNITRTCVSDCDKSLVLWTNNGSNETFCLPSCPTSFYVDNRTSPGVCSPCHSSCIACLGPQDSNCTRCAAGFLQHDGLTLCSLICLRGFIKSTNASNITTCSPCQSECIACAPGWFKINASSCVTNCPIGYELTNSSECIMALRPVPHSYK
jgi:proprotein convertase subtilisin/kexin type 5